MKGKKVTERYDHRITMRVSTTEWLKIMIRAEKESLPPSTWIRQQLKKILPLIILAIIFTASQAFADISASLKTGHIVYSEESKGNYEGTNIYDREFSTGAYLKWEDDWIVRLDYDQHSTGNELQNGTGFAYERFELTQREVMLYGGRKWKNVYGLIGIGYIFNDLYIESYPTDPFSYDYDDSFAFGGIIGYSQPINKRLSVFMEGRYLHSKMNVQVQDHLWNRDFSFEEDTSNLGAFLGLEWRF